MKYCKTCGVLYASSLEQCPKCNKLLTEHEEPEAPEAEKSVKVRQWIGIVIGIPALILFLYFVGWLFKKLLGGA